jgi:flagellum-specific ATP synthase
MVDTGRITVMIGATMAASDTSALAGFIAALDRLPETRAFGSVGNVRGLLVEVHGLAGTVGLGDRLRLSGGQQRVVEAEVVGLRDDAALVLPFAPLDGLRRGGRAETAADGGAVYPHPSWLGRCLDGFGQPIDGAGPLPVSNAAYRRRDVPPAAHQRQRIGGKLDLGVRALNAFLTCCRGQRLGIFAGSGVGKSTLLSMMARFTTADINVIALIGERGREAREFIEDTLGEDGLKRSVVVCATSDQPPMVRRQAAYTAMAVAEFFRDQGADVLLMMDSITRFAMAEREIGLAIGEPPTAKGYTPSVFAALPQLLERAGPGGPGQGSITGLFTVLVDGDDHNEPIADAVRSILDGHVVLDRSIGERGRYPPINILKSVSRALPGCNTAAENQVIGRARRLLAVYDEMAELIRLGAYRRGSDAEIDEAIRLQPRLEGFLAQARDERAPLETVYQQLAAILDAPPQP